MTQFVSKAVLLALHTAPADVAYDSVYGGETLVNRALIAMSKSGIRSVKIICRAGQREKVASLIKAVRKRISFECEILELQNLHVGGKTADGQSADGRSRR